MARTDPRRLSPPAQEDLRRRVVHAVSAGGMGKSAAARTFGVSRQSIDNWLVRVAAAGSVRGLAARKRGPKPRPRLPAAAERAVRRSICNWCPDQLLLPFALWSRDAVAAMIERRSVRTVSVWTAGRYLRWWGFTPQKPRRRAYERDPAAVRAWLKDRYPAIRARAKAERASLLWGDEMGLRSDDQVGRCYGRRGKTPVVPRTGRRFGCNMISALTNGGRLWFMVFEERLTAAVFVRFLDRLLRSNPGRKLFLVVDSHPAYKARRTAAWAAARADRIELFFLPGYSPDLNPDELVNQDAKQAMRKARPRDQRQMMGRVRRHLRGRQKTPAVVKRFFEEEHVPYAAAAADDVK